MMTRYSARQLLWVALALSCGVRPAPADDEKAILPQLQNYSQTHGTVVVFSEIPKKQPLTTPAIENGDLIQLPRIQQEGEWQQSKNVTFLPHIVEGKCDIPEEETYDTLNTVMTFARSLTPQQVSILKEKGGALNFEQLGEEQQQQFIHFIKTYKSDLRAMDGRALTEIIDSPEERKDFKVAVSFHLLASFYSPQFVQGATGGSFAVLPDRWRKRQPLAPAPADTTVIIEKVLDQAISGPPPEKINNTNFLQFSDQKTVDMSRLAPFQDYQPLTKSLRQWVDDIAAVTGLSLRVDRNLSDNPVNIIASLDHKVGAEDLLSSLAASADESAIWRRVGNLYVLSLTNQSARCRQQLIVPAQTLNNFVLDYVFDKFPTELEQLQLSRSLFQAPRRDLNSWPPAVRQFLTQVIERMPESSDKQLLLKGSAKDVQLEFSIISVLSMFYKEREDPWGFQIPAEIEALLIGNQVRLQ